MLSKQEISDWFEVKKTMGVDWWDIKVDNELDNGNMGECVAEPSQTEAEISFKGGMKRADFVKTAIHEAMHCHTSELREYVSNEVFKLVARDKAQKIEKRVHELEEEIVLAVESIVWNLVKERYTSKTRKQ